MMRFGIFTIQRVLIFFAALLLVPTEAFASDVGKCSPQHAMLNNIWTENWEGQLPENYNVLGSTGLVTVSWLNSIDDLEGLIGGLEGWQSMTTKASPASSDDALWDQFDGAHRALVVCLFEQRIAALSDELALQDAIPDEDEVAFAANDARDNGFMYDDDDHGPCVKLNSIAPQGRNSEMAYGQYQMSNSCGYPVKLLACISADRADGTASPNFDNHQDGAKCPGGGWGGTKLLANEMKTERSWYEYARIKWDIMACRDGWDFVGVDGQTFPSGIIGEKYGCRKLR